MKKLAASIVEATAKAVGSKGLTLARAIIPQSLKRKLSRLVTSQIAFSDEVLTTKDGHKFVAINEPVFLHIRLERDYERTLSAIARKLIKPGDTTVDIGANFGWYSMLMAKAVGEGGRVISFEPNAAILPVLERNIALNGYESCIMLHRCGLGASQGLARLVADDKESAVGYIAPGMPVESEGGSESSVEIRALDDVARGKIGDIAYVKVDVEGFEPYVVAGARAVFGADDPPIIQMEYNVEALRRQGVDLAAFAATLDSFGAQVAVVSGDRLVPLASVPALQNNDLFFLPRRGKFAARAAAVL